jgi:hypothetical protein
MTEFIRWRRLITPLTVVVTICVSIILVAREARATAESPPQTPVLSSAETRVCEIANVMMTKRMIHRKGINGPSHARFDPKLISMALLSPNIRGHADSDLVTV